MHKDRHSCLTSIWNRPSSHFDTSAIMACLGHVSNISSSQIATGENPRTKPCRPAMASICSQDNTTELTLPDGLWDILTVCMKNAFDSWAITHRECVIMMYGNFLVDTCLPLPGWLVSQVANWWCLLIDTFMSLFKEKWKIKFVFGKISKNANEWFNYITNVFKRKADDNNKLQENSALFSTLYTIRVWKRKY